MISSAVLGCPLPTCCDGSLKTHTKRLSTSPDWPIFLAHLPKICLLGTSMHESRRKGQGCFEPPAPREPRLNGKPDRSSRGLTGASLCSYYLTSSSHHSPSPDPWSRHSTCRYL